MTNNSFADRLSKVTTVPPPAPVGNLPVAKPAGFSGIKSNTNSDLVYKSVVTKDDIENLGKDIGRSVGETTEKIVQKVALSNFGDLGAILAQVQAEADKLDPNAQFSGVGGWIKSKFKDIKSVLIQQLNSASKVFDDLEVKIADNIAVHQEWVKDLDLLYKENYNHFKAINALIVKATEWKAMIETQIKNLPPIDPNDPEAMMKGELIRELESLKNRAAIKLDNFTRLRIISESNAPKIKSQSETSETTIMTLRDLMEQAIPMIKMEFALYLQSMASKSSQDLIKNGRNLANQTLKRSADAAHDAAITSATSLNDSIVQTDTLDHIRKKMLDTVQNVRKIQSDAQAKRDADAKTLKESSAAYLTELQKNNAI
ncbi:toxic anion resistance protein [Rhizobium phage RHph_TM39]|uniref:Toxic anion resistance protein n=2 Tax=Cuauhnahuacvirus TaxID=3044696 RepID=A0A7S5UXS0_9CAUD|nr:tellurite resistance [Rhizobium phage RHph_TM30]YP_010671377.1 tellurite resistance [Rhizobium phage RHph_Y65]QIG71699.1 toxic anion resistance protein [Rhizobium phage RHph_TM40]QIG72062.1 toxic anion resistance protein [Rhizobium phage RHph_TM2_3B]QIG72424.1 toxic anion resistance protein [Rhizobium phage RHph_TM3_3_6]QIG77202.1 toxic anion resistance protein [Rhizobium phage RHph_TM39]QIG77515.1 toxic anion resistance protein [Rhizobium phage RHph_TM21B]